MLPSKVILEKVSELIKSNRSMDEGEITMAWVTAILEYLDDLYSRGKL